MKLTPLEHAAARLAWHVVRWWPNDDLRHDGFLLKNLAAAIPRRRRRAFLDDCRHTTAASRKAAAKSARPTSLERGVYAASPPSGQRA